MCTSRTSRTNRRRREQHSRGRGRNGTEKRRESLQHLGKFVPPHHRHGDEPTCLLPLRRRIRLGLNLHGTRAPRGERRIALQRDVKDVPAPLQKELESSGIVLPPPGSDDGWTTEWHSTLRPWMASLASAVTDGALLVIDYALEASRYYTARRSDGTLMAYRQGMAGLNPLAQAGEQDLTAHLCIETLTQVAAHHGWQLQDQRRQGEALLALGLANDLHALQRLPATELAQALKRREALLRLVDPAALGDFRWLLYSRGAGANQLSLATGPDNAGSRPG